MTTFFTYLPDDDVDHYDAYLYDAFIAACALHRIDASAAFDILARALHSDADDDALIDAESTLRTMTDDARFDPRDLLFPFYAIAHDHVAMNAAFADVRGDAHVPTAFDAWLDDAKRYINDPFLSSLDDATRAAAHVATL